MPPRYSPLSALGALRPKSAAREHDERRGSAHSRGYDSAWARASKGHLRSHPLCVCCKANGVVRAATLVDHVIPHRGDKALFWDSAKWQSLCGQCHNTIKKIVEAKYDAGLIPVADLNLARPLPDLYPQGGG